MPYIVNITEIEYHAPIAEGVNDERPTSLTFGVDDMDKAFLETELSEYIEEYTGNKIKSFRSDFTFTEELED
jgi:hypothetical protein